MHDVRNLAVDLNRESKAAAIIGRQGRGSKSGSKATASIAIAGCGFDFRSKAAESLACVSKVAIPSNVVLWMVIQFFNLDGATFEPCRCIDTAIAYQV